MKSKTSYGLMCIYKYENEDIPKYFITLVRNGYTAIIDRDLISANMGKSFSHVNNSHLRYDIIIIDGIEIISPSTK
jgi:hypothetical protein